jgi:hypothetical protein
MVGPALDAAHAREPAVVADAGAGRLVSAPARAIQMHDRVTVHFVADIGLQLCKVGVAMAGDLHDIFVRARLSRMR